MRQLIAALLLFLPAVASAQVLTADQDERVKGIIAQLGREVERCSLASNVQDREGPVKVQLDLDKRGKLRKLAVLGDLRKKDVGKCIAAYRPVEPLPSASFSGGKTIRLEFEFHAWAKRSKRKWADVRKQLRDSKVESALLKCVRSAGTERPKKLAFSMQISLAGIVSVETDESEVGKCFTGAAEALQFEASENHYRVEYTWGSSWKPRTAKGFVTEPRECEVEGYPCSWAEADATRVNLGNRYLEQLGKRIDCSDPDPALTWLQKQEHVRWVRTDGCHVSLLVDGARPMSYFGPTTN